MANPTATPEIVAKAILFKAEELQPGRYSAECEFGSFDYRAIALSPSKETSDISAIPTSVRGVVRQWENNTVRVIPVYDASADRHYFLGELEKTSHA